MIRLGPRGVSSGISLREFPKSCIQQVQEICLHYTEKCGGKYVDNKVAARYVHQMSDEIIKQLAGVAAQIRWHEQEPALFKALLDEWKEFFPESLGVHGTPKMISIKLNKQAQELLNYKEQLSELNELRKREIDDVLKSVDIQVHAARISGISERRVMETAQNQQSEHYENLLNQEKSKNELNIKKIIEKYNNEITNIKINQQNDRIKYQKEIDKLNKISFDTDLSWSQKLTLLNEKYENETKKYEYIIEKLNNKLNIANNSIREFEIMNQDLAGLINTKDITDSSNSDSIISDEIEDITIVNNNNNNQFDVIAKERAHNMKLSSYHEHIKPTKSDNKQSIPLKIRRTSLAGDFNGQKGINENKKKKINVREKLIEISNNLQNKEIQIESLNSKLLQSVTDRNNLLT